MKDKLFFFGAYEGQKTAISSVVTDTVPTASLTQGTLKYMNANNGTTTLTRDDLAKMDPSAE